MRRGGYVRQVCRFSSLVTAVCWKQSRNSDESKFLSITSFVCFFFVRPEEGEADNTCDDTYIHQGILDEVLKQVHRMVLDHDAAFVHVCDGTRCGS